MTSSNLVDVSPILSVVVESLPEHAHHKAVRLDVVRVLCQLPHQRTARPPGVIGSRLTHLRLRIRVVIYNVLSVECVCV